MGISKHDFLDAEFVKGRKEKAHQEILSKSPEILLGEDSFQYGIKEKDLPDEGIEFLVWNEFYNERYWHGNRNLTNLSKRPSFSSRLTEEDLRRTSKIVIDQIFRGTSMAAGTPKYSDIWGDFGSQNGSILTRFVNSDDIRKAINVGFWDSISKNSSPLTNEYAGKELVNILLCESFYNDFDFRAGVEKARDVTISPELQGFGAWNQYLIWYLTQQEQIERTLGEQGTETRGKLAAPMVRAILKTDEYSELDEKFRRLLSYFVTSDIIKTQSIQNVLGEVFEDELKCALTGGEYDSKHLEISGNNLIDRKERAKKVLQNIKVNVARITGNLEEYVPEEYYGEYISDLRRRLLESDKFDPVVFDEWMRGPAFRKSATSTHTQVKNQALRRYIEQKLRPAGEVVRRVYGYMPKAGDDRSTICEVTGTVFSDLILRRDWRNANEILTRLSEERWLPRHKRRFLEGVKEYVGLHGKVKLREDGLDDRACRPHYNLIPHFVKNYTDLVDITKFPGKRC